MLFLWCDIDRKWKNRYNDDKDSKRGGHDVRYIDLTLQVKKSNRVYKQAEVQLKKHIVMGHVGTHFDIYGEVQLPLEYMQTRGILFDVSHIKDREITIDDVDLDYVKPGDFVMFHTGSIERHPYGSGLYFSSSTQFSWELIQELAMERVKFVGIDAPDLRKGKDHVEADKLFLKYGTFVIENLTNLSAIEPQSVCKMLTMWHEDPEATGIKCRVVAVQPE